MSHFERAEEKESLWDRALSTSTILGLAEGNRREAKKLPPERKEDNQAIILSKKLEKKRRRVVNRVESF